jgi:hypothetical protein
MENMLDGEELLKHGYTRCYFLTYYCRRCGSCRMVVELPPDTLYIQCPRCRREHCHSGVLRVVAAFTKRSLPQPAEIWAPAVGELRFGKDDNDEFLLPTPKRRQTLTKGRRLAAVP